MDSHQIERIARRRAGAKLGWYIHAGVYLSVNLLLAAIAAASASGTWVAYPALGWGLGLAIHGVVVFFVGGSGGLHDKLVARERERLALQRDPW